MNDSLKLTKVPSQRCQLLNLSHAHTHASCGSQTPQGRQTLLLQYVYHTAIPNWMWTRSTLSIGLMAWRPSCLGLQGVRYLFWICQFPWPAWHPALIGKVVRLPTVHLSGHYICQGWVTQTTQAVAIRCTVTFMLHRDGETDFLQTKASLILFFFPCSFSHCISLLAGITPNSVGQ